MVKPTKNSNAPLTAGQQWQEWAAAAQKGDKKSYNKLLTAIAPYIRNIVMPSLSHADAADDVMQEVLISVHKSLNTYDPSKPFKPWLSAIINFRRTDYLRKHYAKRDDQKTTLDHPEFIAQNVTNMGHAGELKDIENALSDLPKKQREIFQLIKIEGYTAEEVAEKMDMKVSAVKVSAHRTFKRLKGVLGE
ncbi:MAG: sigma-70 family RNA polymerase sigma factor [Alphaproteobacteria bacterium]|nr:sigma-70 family RNA polymerase sigma factor [Alphaproteobacteria bacterium]NCQ87942.1 sigma-70 family RNA polymerase sigma factor [Alphaproteobacteria bacterium]NCT05551.1 sigma-70 family RNA polymerase sigma factor [Alphaproteobacteria bacterium]